MNRMGHFQIISYKNYGDYETWCMIDILILAGVFGLNKFIEDYL